MDLLGALYRTHTCGDLRAEHVGKDVVLLGWVHRVRDMGAVIFLDIRDRYGVTQVVTESEPLLSQAKKLKTEMVVAVLGQVAPRSPETVNEKLETGQVEVRIGEVCGRSTMPAARRSASPTNPSSPRTRGCGTGTWTSAGSACRRT